MPPQQAVINFGSSICRHVLTAARREWLVTNGIGGYAMGTICGIPTRQYHGYLIAALKPPLGRTLLLAKLDETLSYDGQDYDLFANHWASGLIEPTGFEHLLNFRLEGMTPVWTFACADALLEKRVWMEPGANTTYIQYRLRRSTLPATLSVKCLVSHRDHHGGGSGIEWLPAHEFIPSGLSLIDGATSLYLLSADAAVEPRSQWYRDYYMSAEAYRGLNAHDSYLHAAQLTMTLRSGESLTLVASTETEPDLNGDAAFACRQDYEQALLERAAPPLPSAPPSLHHLVLAADQFIVARASSDDVKGRSVIDGHSVIAGYPWFSDWGRDTMISLPGLTLTTGRHDIARSILRTFAHHVDQGMLPNRFPDAGEEPEYNTVDATLWYFEALRTYLDATDDTELLDELLPVLEDIIAWHIRGTRYNIHMDPADSLIFAGVEGVQLTWMDAKVGAWVVTPRIGKPVEINALWYNALRTMADFAEQLGEREKMVEYSELAERVLASFARYWHGEAGYCHDVLDGPIGDDLTPRANQLLAVSLPYSPLSHDQQRAVVDVCSRKLLTPYGLRGLAPDHSDYIGHYGGDEKQRDAAYHQGTAWGWLIGPFVSAHLRVYGDVDLARSYLTPLLQHLSDHGVGSMSEIFDGDPPFTPRGCPAQAWTVAEVLRAWEEIAKKAQRKPA